MAMRSRSPLKFFLLTFALAIPFWVVGGMVNLQILLGLPLAALMFVCPGLAALVLVREESGPTEAKALLKKALDYKSISANIWYAPILLLTPAISVLAYLTLRATGTHVPIPKISVLPTLALFAIFFVTASGEELGWSGYALDPLQQRSNSLMAGLLLGTVWAAWHWLPLVQIHRSVEWIAWWTLWSISARVIMTCLYNRSGRSVFGAVLYHAVSNVCWQSFPVHGSFFDPRATGLITTFVAVVASIAWGPRTVAGQARRAWVD